MIFLKLKSIFFILIFIMISFVVYSQSLGDVNEAGAVNIIDALLITQFYVGLITEFPGSTEIPTPVSTETPTPVPQTNSPY